MTNRAARESEYINELIHELAKYSGRREPHWVLYCASLRESIRLHLEVLSIYCKG